MSRLNSGRYSEGELSDSPCEGHIVEEDVKDDDIGLSLSEDDENNDVLEIKPPVPTYKSRGESKSSRSASSHHSDNSNWNKKYSKSTGKDDLRHSDHRERRSHSGKNSEDLRKRLERDRRLRKHSDRNEYKQRNESRSSRKSKERKRKEIQTEDTEEVEDEKDLAPQGGEHSRKTTSDYLVVSSPESVKHLLKEDSELEDQHNSLSEQNPTSSDEGETSSSDSSSSTVGERSPDVKQNTEDRETLRAQSMEPIPKRSKKDEELEMLSATNKEDVSDVPPQEEFPPYMPAIQGCRSVGEFQCLNKIEEGTYGVVYRAQDKRTNEIVALKRLKMEREKEGFPITSLREVSTLLKAQHENIVTVREIVVGSNMDSIFMVMDYVEHDLKSLMEVLKGRKQFFLPGEVKCLLQQLLRAVAHLHDNWILHRDLKTSNILLSHSGILKVGDFGLAREYGSPLKEYTSIVVTLWYRAPELLLGIKEYSTPIDVWSVGCIFGELLTLEAIFQGKFEHDQINRIFRELGTPNDNIWPGYSDLPFVKKATFTNNPISNLRKRFSSRLSELGVDLMQKFLTYDPSKRITAEEALNHTYLKEPPYPINPAMLPSWPAKSELNGPRKAQSPKPPSGGRAYKQLNDDGFHMGGAAEMHDRGVGPGFSLRF